MNSIPVTDERLLDLALRAICADEEDCGFANEICRAYISSYHPEFSEDQIEESLVEMVIDFSLNDMVKKNIIDVEFDDNGEIRYSLNEEQNNTDW